MTECVVLGWRLGLAALVVVAAVVRADAGIDPLPPRTVIDAYSCADLAGLNEEGRERALIYLAGVVDGRRDTKVLDLQALAVVIDRVMQTCAARPGQAVVESFIEAWR